MVRFSSVRCLYAYISDVHLERWHPQIIPTIKHTIPPCETKGLVLAGDIGNPFQTNYRNFLKLCAETYKQVYFTTGNHEYDKHTNAAVEKQVVSIADEIENLHYLQNTVAIMEDEMLFGSTLWSNRVQPGLHLDAKNALLDAIEEARMAEVNLLVMTHYVPSRQLIEPRYRNYKNHRNFYSDLENLMEPPVVCWICGHSHSIQTKKINNVFLGMNCVGYKIKDIIIEPQYFTPLII